MRRANATHAAAAAAAVVIIAATATILPTPPIDRLLREFDRFVPSPGHLTAAAQREAVVAVAIVPRLPSGVRFLRAAGRRWGNPALLPAGLVEASMRRRAGDGNVL